jgi:hypothetical protein
MRPFGLVLLTGDAFGVDAEEHGQAVPGPLGDLKRSAGGFEPSGYAAYRRAVGAAGQQ